MSGFWMALVSLSAGVVSALFAALVLARYAHPRPGGGRPHSPSLLLWGIGLAMYALAALAQAHRALAGFTPGAFRIWYLFGAILVAAYLGQGTAYLLLPRRTAHGLMALLLAGSAWAALRVATATLDPGAAAGLELTGAVIRSPGVRVLTPVFNIYGTLWLVGGAAYSAWVFYRRRIDPHRMTGNLLIAAGALAPAMGGTLNRLGLPGLYVGELVGAVVMYVGFLRASAPAAVPHPVMVTSSPAPPGR